MKATVLKYMDGSNETNETTEVSVGDEVMYYDDKGYELVGNIIDIIDVANGEKRLIPLLAIKHPGRKGHTIKAAIDCYSENA